MKGSTVIVTLSLVGNVALLGAILFWAPASKKESTEIAAANGTTPVPKSPLTPADRKLSLSPSPTVSNTGTWNQLHDRDLATVAARLRAAGFPPAMVRVAMGALIDEQFAGRLRAIASTAEKPFWKSRSDAYDPKIEAQISAVRREQRALMRQLLGDDLDNPQYRTAMIREFGSELPLAKRERIETVKRVFEEKFSEAQAKIGAATWLPEDQDNWRRLTDQMRAEIVKILSPEEVAEYDLRNSQTSGRLRYELTAFHPTEAEFRALYPLQRMLDEQFPILNGSTQEQMAPRDAAQAQMSEQIKALLGADRYAEYQLARDIEYRETMKVVDRLGLAPSTATEIHVLHQDTQQRSFALRSNRNLSAEERTVQLAALADEVSAKIGGVLGADGLEAYKQHGGQWLQQLTPRPRAAPKAP